MRSTLAALSSACMLLVASAAGAITLTSTPNAALPDNDPAGLLDSIDTSGVFNPLDVVTSVYIEVSIDHTYVGDLAIELISPSGTELQILARPRSNAGNEQTGAPFGDSSNLSAANPLTFQDGAATSAEDLGLGVGGGGNVPSGVWAPDADGWATDITLFAGFNGELAAGNWTLKVADYAGADTGTLVAWSLIIVPEPSTGVLLTLGLIGLVFVGRRRDASAA